MSLFKSKEDKLYYEIACRADEIILESIVGEMPSREELEKMYTFSEEFERKMRVLIESIGRRRIIPMRVKRIIVIAAIIAALILGALGASAILKSVYNLYIISHRVDHSVATYNETSDTDHTDEIEIKEIYQPSFVPDGYVVDNVVEWDAGRKTRYSNESDFFIFTQSDSSIVMQLDTENNPVVYISADNIEAYYLSQNGFITFVWEKYGYAFKIEGPISYQTALQLAQSISKVE